MGPGSKPELTAETLLRAYAIGIFPMAEGRDDPMIHWVDPRKRGILPLDQFHISRSLKRQILSKNYTIRTNSAFLAVMQACADRSETWINETILDLYLTLHHTGFAHSLEVWQKDDLIGGVYGVGLGQVFFGESMFSRRPGASKIALAWLVDRLRLCGFTLFDTQFLTPHLASLGGVEIPRAEFHHRLETALQGSADFAADIEQTPYSVMQRNTQTS